MCAGSSRPPTFTLCLLHRKSLLPLFRFHLLVVIVLHWLHFRSVCVRVLVPLRRQPSHSLSSIVNLCFRFLVLSSIGCILVRFAYVYRFDTHVVDESRCPNYRVFFNSFKVFSNYPNSFMRNILLNQMKNRCYEDIKSGLWGPQCKLSMRAKENCALRCLCPQCYELVYESDPLEEGESNYARSLEYKLCLYKLSYGETLEGVRGAFDC